jgi:Uma2 family endonuclease
MTMHLVQSGDGLERRAFSVDDVRRMVDAGIMDAEEPVELREGELIAMPAEKFAHGRASQVLARKLFRDLPDDWIIGPESTLQLGPKTLVQPDFLICPAGLAQPSDEGFLAVAGPDVFIIEVADSSLLRDRSVKARLYARCEVREYWIVDLNGGRILVHRPPEHGAYQETSSVEGTEVAQPHPPGPPFQLSMGDLELD